MNTPPPPLILVGPSGAGKTTLARELVAAHPERFTFSISATTRPPRGEEQHGIDYFFLDRPTFERMIEAGELAEWATVHGELYGTPIANLMASALGNRRPLLDIDVQGARQVGQRIDHAMVIFLLPPSPDAWIERLVGRGTEEPSQIVRRLRTALSELEAASAFSDFVVNAHLDDARRDVCQIVEGELNAGISALKAESLCGELREGAEREILRLQGAGE